MYILRGNNNIDKEIILVILLMITLFQDSLTKYLLQTNLC